MFSRLFNYSSHMCLSSDTLTQAEKQKIAEEEAAERDRQEKERIIKEEKAKEEEEEAAERDRQEKERIIKEEKEEEEAAERDRQQDLLRLSADQEAKVRKVDNLLYMHLTIKKINSLCVSYFLIVERSKC